MYLMENYDNYSLCGYLSLGFQKGNTVSTYKRRWFVYSNATCKLYYYKFENDPVFLGEINIALATFSYDPAFEGNFIIHSSDAEYFLKAASSNARQYWLQNLQNARRSFLTCKENLCSSVNKIDEKILDDTEFQKNLEWGSMSEERHCAEKGSNNGSKTLELLKDMEESSFFNVNSHRRYSQYDDGKNYGIGDIGRKLRRSLRIKKSISFGGYNDSHTASCAYCIELMEELRAVREDYMAKENESKASKEVIDLMHKELNVLKNENTTLISLNKNDLLDKDVLAILQTKDRQLLELDQKNNQLSTDNSQLNSKLLDAQNKFGMFSNLLEAKDKAIIQLSSDLSAADDSFPKVISSKSVFYLSNALPVTLVTQGTQTYLSNEESLQDSLEAYKQQNAFLNKEILELNYLKKQLLDREQKLISESSEWEAKYYQIESKYLLLLNDLHSPQDSQHDPNVVAKLLQDVVEAHGTPDLRSICNKGKLYDEFGFYIAYSSETLYSQVKLLQRKNHLLADSSLSNVLNICVNKWESLLANTSGKELPRHKEFKLLGKVWKLLVEARLMNFKNAVSSTYYQDLLARFPCSINVDPSAKQIELDLLRTLPNNWHYDTIHADGIPKLRRVLLAYSRHNPRIGYCQGFNRLVAIALLFLNEEDAFWCLVCIVECLMPEDYYTKDLLGSQVDQRVLKDLLLEKLPQLSGHLLSYNLDISVFTFNWFLCIFVDIVPPSAFLTIWDSFLHEGPKVLFRYALAVFKLCESAILEIRDSLEILKFIRSVPEPLTNISKLQEVAFSWADPLPIRVIREKRAHYYSVVKAELEKFDAIRKSYYCSRTESESFNDNDEYEVRDEGFNAPELASYDLLEDSVSAAVEVISLDNMSPQIIREEDRPQINKLFSEDINSESFELKAARGRKSLREKNSNVSEL